MMMSIKICSYNRKLGLEEGDYILVRDIKKLSEVGYEVVSFKKINVEGRLMWVLCVKILSPCASYNPYAELPCKEFVRQEGCLVIQRHIVKKISEQEAFLLVL